VGGSAAGVFGQSLDHNVVDASNLALFELGHPMHAYDADRIQGGQIRVRIAAKGNPCRSLMARA